MEMPEKENTLLFVLRYDVNKMLWRLFFPYAIVIPVILITAINGTGKNHGYYGEILIKLLSFGLVIAALYLIYDMLTMEGIYLYENKITKFYKTGKEKTLLLEKARYNALSNLFMGFMSIHNEDTPYLLRNIRDIYFDEKLSMAGDVREFREILSQISGQKIVDLENQSFSKKLMNR